MIYDIDFHAFDEADQRVVGHHRGHEAELVDQQRLDQHSLKRLNAEEVEVIALAMAYLEAECGAAHQSSSGEQWFGLKAFQQPKSAFLDCACL